MDDILFSSGASTEEIQEFMSMDVLHSINHEHAKQVDEDDEELIFIHTHQVSFDDIMRLQIATKLIEILFTIDGWTEEYTGLSNDVNNPLNEVLDVFRKMEYYMVAQKKDMKHQKTD